MLMMVKFGIFGAAPLVAQPYLAGGGWEGPSDDGWVGGSVTSGNAHSGTYKLVTNNTGSSFTFTTVGDLSVVFGVRHRCATSSSVVTRAAYLRVNGGSYVGLAGVSDNSVDYALLSGFFTSTSGATTEIRIQSDGSVYWDDWVISGSV